jgi:hypothetical protein
MPPFMILALIVLMAAIYALESVDAHVNKYSPNLFIYFFFEKIIFLD